MPTARQLFKTIALIGNDRDTRVVESLQILASHLDARGRHVLADPAQWRRLRLDPVERRPEAALAQGVRI